MIAPDSVERVITLELPTQALLLTRGPADHT